MNEQRDAVEAQRSLVRNAAKLPDAELTRLFQYLAVSKVGNLMVPLIRDFRAPVLGGRVRGSEDIGQLRMWWGKLGPWFSRELFNANRFNAAQAHGVLHVSPYRDHPASDQSAREKTARYRRLFSTPESSPIVTLLDVGFDVFLADGNHTAVAAFWHARDQAVPYELPIHFVDASSLSEPDKQQLRDALPEIYSP